VKFNIQLNFSVCWCLLLIWDSLFFSSILRLRMIIIVEYFRFLFIFWYFRLFHFTQKKIQKLYDDEQRSCIECLKNHQFKMNFYCFEHLCIYTTTFDDNVHGKKQKSFIINAMKWKILQMQWRFFFKATACATMNFLKRENFQLSASVLSSSCASRLLLFNISVSHKKIFNF
jgi:hypothetical protein